MTRLIWLLVVIAFLTATVAVAQEPEPTPIEVMRGWCGVHLVDGGSGDFEAGAEIEFGIVIPFSSIYVIGQVNRVFQGGIVENDENVWYVEVGMDEDSTVLVMLTGYNNLSAVSYLPIDGDTPIYPSNEVIHSFDTSLFVEYLQANPHLPVIIEYSPEMDSQIDAARASDDPQVIELIRLYDLGDTAEFLTTTQTLATSEYLPAEEIGNWVLFNSIIWAPGFFEYAEFDPEAQ